MSPAARPNLAAAAGFSLIELLIAMGLTTLIMGATLSTLSDVARANDLVMSVSSMNNALRAGADMMIRDFLQAGSGLPSSHTVNIPNGVGAGLVNLPGPPNTAFTLPAGTLVMSGVMPLAGQGPTINGVATDVVSVLMADNDFLEVGVTDMGASFVIVAPGPNLGAGPTRVVEGQLMLISKQSVNTLVQVTNVDVAARRLTFADGDSLNINQSQAPNGNLPALIAEQPLDDPDTGGVNESFAATRISRMRLITYYLDATTAPLNPRLVRRVNNGDPLVFDNTLGTAVALDVIDLQFTYDINNGTGNPGGVEMNAADIAPAGNGACNPDPCGPTQIRKINLRVTSRPPNIILESGSGFNTLIRNTLESQVSLRAMAFVDRYQ
jgi:hypothetical protein